MMRHFIQLPTYLFRYAMKRKNTMFQVKLCINLLVEIGKTFDLSRNEKFRRMRW